MTAAPEPIRDVAHIGHVELLTPRPEASLHYFTALLGMEAVHREGQSAWLRAYGDYAVWTLKLTEAAQPGIGLLGWRAVKPAGARTPRGGGRGGGARRRLDQWRFRPWRDLPLPRSGRARDGDLLRRGALRAAAGTALHLGQPADEISRSRHRRAPGPTMSRCCARTSLPTASSWKPRCGLSLREQVLYENGTKEIGSWMSPSPVHHEVAYVLDTASAHGRLHHFSLWTDNRDDVLRAADIFRENNIFSRVWPVEAQQQPSFLHLLLRAGRQPGGDLYRQLPRLRARLRARGVGRDGARHRGTTGVRAAGQLHALRDTRCRAYRCNRRAGDRPALRPVSRTLNKSILDQ